MSVQKVSDAMITALSASKLSGTIADARFPATLPALDGSNLTGAPALDGSNLTGGVAKTTSDQSWTGSQRATMVVDNDGSFDMNAGQNFKCTPTGNFTLTFTNITNGQSGYYFSKLWWAYSIISWYFKSRCNFCCNSNNSWNIHPQLY